MKNCAYIMLLLLTMIIAGCATQEVISRLSNNDHKPLKNAEAGEIIQWVDQELAPYIEKQFKQHPWLKNKTFSIGAMRDEDILPEINRLSEEIRIRLAQHLRGAQGVQMSWRPVQEPLQHHRSMDNLANNLECIDMDPVEIFVGIETRQLMSGELQINVSAVDKEDQQWVPNFGKNWRGLASRNVMDSLNMTKVDERLRGLRPLPFEPDEPDLLASYLATNLSCLFQRGVENHEELMVFVDRDKGSQNPSVVNRAFEMLDSYLNRMNRVRITDHKDKANVVMERNVVDVNESLMVLWVRNTFQDGSRVQGVETEVYVRKEKKSSP